MTNSPAAFNMVEYSSRALQEMAPDSSMAGCAPIPESP